MGRCGLYSRHPNDHKRSPLKKTSSVEDEVLTHRSSSSVVFFLSWSQLFTGSSTKTAPCSPFIAQTREPFIDLPTRHGWRFGRDNRSRKLSSGRRTPGAQQVYSEVKYTQAPSLRFPAHSTEGETLHLLDSRWTGKRTRLSGQSKMLCDRAGLSL